MTQTKIQERFYPLTTSELVKVSALLKDAELRVYLYLMTVNPFGDLSPSIDTAEIAEKLNLTRRTIQRALNRLEELDLIEIQISRFQFRRKWKKVSPDLPAEAEATHGSLEATHGSPKRHTDRQRASEGLHSKGSESPHTYSDFINTLSLSEREKFLEFGLNKVGNLPKPPALPKKWIERNWQELYADFLSIHPTPSVDPALLEQQQQDHIDATRKELAELLHRQQQWKQQSQGVR